MLGLCDGERMAEMQSYLIFSVTQNNLGAHVKAVEHLPLLETHVKMLDVYLVGTYFLYLFR